RGFREHAKEASLRRFQHHASLEVSLPEPERRGAVLAYLQRAGFAARVSEREDGVLIAAKQGSWSRIGYFLAHGAIVLICLGGLLDGNLPLKLQMALGGKKTTSGEQLISDIKPESRLGLDNWSFRGNVFIPEGKSAGVAVLNVKDGILLQELPFTVSLKKFHIEHYDTGMPKRFASDILITDNATGKSVEKTIEVNKPFEFDGIMMYQASFEDGGSRLKLLGRSLLPGESTQPVSIDATVGEASRLHGAKYDYALEITGFRPVNVENMADPAEAANAGALAQFQSHLGSGAKSPARKDLRNVGPSFQFKLRDSAGQAREYQNYMQPVQQDGRWYLLTGMRQTQAEAFRFMRMPMDENGKIDTWFAVRDLMLNPANHAELARRFALSAASKDTAETVRQRLIETAERTLQLFSIKGFETVGKFIESSVPKAEQDKAADVFVKVLQSVTWEAWQLARSRAGLPPLDINEDRALFVRDTVNALSDSLHYGAPLYLQLAGFQEVQASVLQVTRSPGKPVVYLGSLLLVLGVFAMLYIRERRLFVLVKRDGPAVIALSANRKSMEVDEVFHRHVDGLRQVLNPGAATASASNTEME
ncbi:MAG: cytochrome c biogenesis protein ResB, partial [Zoogloea sp.]|nr:cytochrome c biogenesis protein ResB [Zoogloea sp.]